MACPPPGECCICLASFAPDRPRAALPCCAPPHTSTSAPCAPCARAWFNGGLGGVGRCPVCRALVRVNAGGRLERSGPRCDMCCWEAGQDALDDDSVCESCNVFLELQARGRAAPATSCDGSL